MTIRSNFALILQILKGIEGPLLVTKAEGTLSVTRESLQHWTMTIMVLYGPKSANDDLFLWG